MGNKIKIMNAIIEVLGTTREELTEQNRTKEIAQKRILFYYFSAENWVNYRAIGDYINRDRATAHVQTKKVRGMVEVSKTYAKEVEKLRIKINNKLK